MVVAGGLSPMTGAPPVDEDSRSGYKYGDVTVLDHAARRCDVFTDQPIARCRQHLASTCSPAPNRAVRGLRPPRRCGMEGRRIRRRGDQ